MTSSVVVQNFSDEDAARLLHAPRPNDDKYSRGVVGFLTGSPAYPGAAVLGVSAALSLGVGMVRFVGAPVVANLVLQHRPEVVCRDGHADVWVLGSGVDPDERGVEETQRMQRALGSPAPTVLDAGALDLIEHAGLRTIITPHVGELVRMFARAGEVVDPHEVAAEPAPWARRAAEQWQVAVVLKGHRTLVAVPHRNSMLQPVTGSSWLSTAGTGDALAGAIGAVLAPLAARQSAHSEGPLSWEVIAAGVAAAANVHARASNMLAGPFTALALAEELSDARRAIVSQVS